MRLGVRWKKKKFGYDASALVSSHCANKLRGENYNDTFSHVVKKRTTRLIQISFTSTIQH